MTQNEKLLAETLLNVLIKDGVLTEDATLTGPELICAAETYCDARPGRCRECGGIIGSYSLTCNSGQHTRTA